MAAIALALAIGASSASAGDGSSFSVVTSATVQGSVVSGNVRVTNEESDATTFTAISGALEVRFDSGAPPPLPAGSSGGWYTVASAALAVPVTLAPGAFQDFPFVIDVCAGGFDAFGNAEALRAYARVEAGRIRDDYSADLAMPAPCPLCGNRIVEAGEQCDAGGAGGPCCTASCQFRTNGTLCSDGNACTQVDRCQTGACVGSDPVACVASDMCHDAGICNPATGACSDPPRANGTPCSDGNACTRVDACQGGTCVGADPVACEALGTCVDVGCDPSSGECTRSDKPDGTGCTDADACTTDDRCEGGACVGGAPLACNDHMSCTIDACDATFGCGFSAAPSCEACDAAQCTTCGSGCESVQSECELGCWAGFSSCLAGCTSTYCAPFCQVDLGRCIASCPTADSCQAACETGNGCGAGCSGTLGVQGAPPPVPAFSRPGFVALVALLALVGGAFVERRGRFVA